MSKEELEFMGTNTGPIVMGGNEIPPTNKPLTGRGTYIARVRNGKIVEFSSHPDAAGMMMQLGMMPGARRDRTRRSQRPPSRSDSLAG